MVGEITYLAGNESVLDDIKELWEALNQHHFEHSPYFKKRFSDFTFDSRKAFFREKAKNGKLLVLLALHKICKVGYCVASVVNNVGEIDSIYIQPEYRSLHIGTKLLEDSLNWIKEHNPKKIIAGVAAGNEKSFDFYSKFGFAPSTTILQYVE